MSQGPAEVLRVEHQPGGCEWACGEAAQEPLQPSPTKHLVGLQTELNPAPPRLHFFFPVLGKIMFALMAIDRPRGAGPSVLPVHVQEAARPSCPRPHEAAACRTF